MRPLTTHDLTDFSNDCSRGIFVSAGYLSAGDHRELGTITIDSRVPGDTFFCLRGPNADGHEFAEKAIENGAKVIVADTRGAARLVNTLGDRATIIMHPQPQLALSLLAYLNREQFQGCVIGVSGSAGKTTTKEMLARVLSTKGPTLATKGNQNNHLGVPLTLLRLNDSYEFAVVEMGISARNELTWLASLAKPNLGVLTSVGAAHLENLHSLEGVANAKGELFQSLPSNGAAFLPSNISYPWVLTRNLKAPITFVGDRPSDALRLINPHDTESGAQAQVALGDARWPLKLQLQGQHNLYNALLALAVGLKCGVDLRAALQALSEMEPPHMRGETITLPNGTPAVLDCYNANPLSMRSAVENFAKRFPNGILVLGDMLELGETSNEAHRELGQTVASLPGEHHLIAVGNAVAQTVEAAIESGFPKERAIFAKDHDAAFDVLSNLMPCEAILFKASRGIALERIVARFQAQKNQE